MSAFFIGRSKDLVLSVHLVFNEVGVLKCSISDILESNRTKLLIKF
jgi:hypothetical protein